jgi:hypothetical protein
MMLNSLISIGWLKLKSEAWKTKGLWFNSIYILALALALWQQMDLDHIGK